jgi:mannosyltransferase OCH1-like enzyme
MQRVAKMGLSFGNFLNRRSHDTNSQSSKQETVLPTTKRTTTSINVSKTKKTTKYKRFKRIKTICIDLIFKLKANSKPDEFKFQSMILCLLRKIFFIACLSILFVSLCLAIISKYNARSLRDPCKIAMTSRNDLRRMSYIERNTTLTISSLASANENRKSIISVTQFQMEAIQATAKKSIASYRFRSNIPKIIHQQWKDEYVPTKYQKWRQRWLELYPDPEYAHMLWTDKKGRELIQTHYSWFLDTYDDYEHNINRANAVRYFILHHYGGIYADLDYEPLRNFYNLLPMNQVGMVESPYYWNERIQNSLLSSPINDLFWLDLFIVLIQNSKQMEVFEATGPVLLDEAIEYSTQPTYTLPCENFQRVPLGEYDQTLWTPVYDQEIAFRFKPISKNCGYYRNDQCHFGRHHNTVGKVPL